MLSLINVEINAKLDRFENTMWRAADIADASMSQASANADQFQSAFERASSGAGQSADRMAVSFEAANDRVMSAADQAASSIDDISKAADQVDMRSWQEKMSEAFGQGVGGGMAAAQTWFDKMEEFAAAKIKVIGIGLAIGLVSAGAAAIYTGYRIVSSSIGFIAGLFSGESYKSENIDALIALNKEVKTLQEGLHTTAVNASAVNEALKAGGVDPSSYISTMDSATKAARSNTEELDRLGVKYKDANGQLLSQQEILINAKAKLDEYTDGYDRNAAAAAIGMGSYKQISDAVSITTEKVETAKQRLIDYNLVIGSGTQEAVTAYEQSMRAFNRELDLTSQGFKKAIADQIMPVLTDLSDFFRDGFPMAVGAFRYSMAILTSLFYGLKEVVYVVTESIIDDLLAVSDVVSRVAGALIKAASGDMSGAWAELKAVPDDLGKRWDNYWANLSAQSERNVKAMKLAWGADSLGANDAQEKARQGKAWVPKASEEKAGKAAHDPNGYEAFVQKLQRENAALEQNEYVMLKVEAAQKAFAEGKSADAALLAIEERQILASNKAYQEFSARLEEENKKLLDKRGAIGLVGIELDVYNMQEHKRMEATTKINDLMRSGKPLTDDVRQAMIDAGQASADAAESIMRANAALERSFDAGATVAFKTYLDDAGNAAKASSQLFGNAFRGMEDALTKFATSGKLDFKSLADSIISDLVRIQIRASITTPLAKAMDGSGVFSAIGKMLGFDPGPSASAIPSDTPGFSSGDIGNGLRLPSMSADGFQSSVASQVPVSGRSAQMSQDRSSSGSGIVIQQTIHAPGAEVGVETRIAQAAHVAAQAAVAKVQDLMRRNNPAMRGAMG